jgi:hypothetical protein
MHHGCFYYICSGHIDPKQGCPVAKAIFEQWFCKFGIPAQIHKNLLKEFLTKRMFVKEFVNKLLAELCELLNVQHSKTTPYHPQCNAQVEVFNKTVKKYLASYVDETTLNWYEFLLALMLAYNTSYHSTIATTPFELLFGVRPRLPSLPALEIQRQHFGESLMTIVCHRTLFCPEMKYLECLNLKVNSSCLSMKIQLPPKFPKMHKKNFSRAEIEQKHI